jgi:hypothetical protein
MLQNCKEVAYKNWSSQRALLDVWLTCLVQSRIWGIADRYYQFNYPQEGV